jgi:hypothetical protein
MAIILCSCTAANASESLEPSASSPPPPSRPPSYSRGPSAVPSSGPPPTPCPPPLPAPSAAPPAALPCCRIAGPSPQLPAPDPPVGSAWCSSPTALEMVACVCVTPGAAVLRLGSASAKLAMGTCMQSHRRHRAKRFKESESGAGVDRVQRGSKQVKAAHAYPLKSPTPAPRPSKGREMPHIKLGAHLLFGRRLCRAPSGALLLRFGNLLWGGSLALNLCGLGDSDNSQRE